MYGLLFHIILNGIMLKKLISDYFHIVFIIIVFPVFSKSFNIMEYTEQTLKYIANILILPQLVLKQQMLGFCPFLPTFSD